MLFRCFNFLLYLRRDLRVLFEELSCILPSLSESHFAVAVECTGLLDDVLLGGYIEDFTYFGNTLIEKDVDLAIPEGGCDLILDHFHFDSVSCSLPLVSRSRLDLILLPDIQSLGSIEFEGVSTGSGLRISEHDADLHPDLIDEYDGSGRF